MLSFSKLRHGRALLQRLEISMTTAPAFNICLLRLASKIFSSTALENVVRENDVRAVEPGPAMEKRQPGAHVRCLQGSTGSGPCAHTVCTYTDVVELQAYVMFYRKDPLACMGEDSRLLRARALGVRRGRFCRRVGRTGVDGGVLFLASFLRWRPLACLLQSAGADANSEVGGKSNGLR